MSLLRKSAVRIPIVMIGAVAWLAISNHCALVAFEGAAKMPMANCHGMTQSNHSPSKHEQKGDVECCKSLRATLLTLASNVAKDAQTFSADNYVVAQIIAAQESHLARVFEWDTGPPGADSFAESVLQRSILAHAPPVSLS